MVATDLKYIPPLEPIKKAQVFLWVCTSVLFFSFVVWFPIGGFVASIFTPLPSSLAVYQWGIPLGLIVPLASLMIGAIFMGIFGIVTTIPYFALFLLMGSLIGVYGRTNKSIDASVFVPSLIIFLIGTAIFWLKSKGVEGSIWDMMSQKVAKVIITLAKEHGAKSSEITPYLEEQIRSIANLMVRLLPGISFASLLLTATVNVLATKRYIVKHQLPLPNWQEASLWRSPEWFVWLVIASGFLTMMPSTRIVGLNILIGFGIVYLFQGLSIVLFFLTRWKVPLWAKVIILFFILTQQYLALAGALLGLFDVWFDVRSITRKKQGVIKP